jgi:predicted nucleic acid-binding protein
VIGITLDTGALIALERRRQRMKEIVERALAKDQPITVPADVVGEWWRGRTDLRDRILESMDVEPLTEPLAKLAGEALAAVKGATLVDAIVMASAASRGDVVYSSDIEDLQKLARHFPGVRVLAT